MPTTYHLSPLCVFHAAADERELVLHHALHGTRFRVSPELVDGIAALLRGSTLDEVGRAGGPELRASLDALIQEEVILGTEALQALGGASLFQNRLGPIPLAVQRAFTEGGQVGQVDLESTPPPLGASAEGLEEIPLSRHESGGEPDSFLEVLARRRSRRDFSSEPLRFADLERFLEIGARMQTVERSGGGEVGFRAFPSGGGLQPLEIYPVVRNVDSLEEGFYRYDALGHRLLRLPDHPEAREALFDVTARKMGLPPARTGEPAVLFVVTAVVGRTCWKYEGIEYALILQEVGALYQTFYLVATQLGLAPCAVGAFPELAMAEVLSLDPLDEIQVGLFALGAVDEL